jgi:hypothetical protein
VTRADALEFVHTHGVVLESGSGPVPSLAQAIAGAPIRGSWWAHPRSHEIFVLTRAVRADPDVLVCRLVSGKMTYVHRRLWPALVRLADRFPSEHLAQVREEHTASGRHVRSDVAFSSWVSPELAHEATGLSEEAAVKALGLGG